MFYAYNLYIHLNRQKQEKSRRSTAQKIYLNKRNWYPKATVSNNISGICNRDRFWQQNGLKVEYHSAFVDPRWVCYPELLFHHFLFTKRIKAPFILENESTLNWRIKTLFISKSNTLYFQGMRTSSFGHLGIIIIDT